MNEGVFSGIARGFGRQDNNEGIVGVYEIWTEKYPESVNAHLSLAKAYITVENTKEAKASFKKALKVDPDNEEAKAGLDKLN